VHKTNLHRVQFYGSKITKSGFGGWKASPPVGGAKGGVSENTSQVCAVGGGGNCCTLQKG